MPIIIHPGRCDHAPECDGPKVCPTKALTYDPEEKKLKVDITKCSGCGACVKTCPADAFILVAPDEYEAKLKEILLSIENERSLFVPRYGGCQVDDSIELDEASFAEEIKKCSAAIEFWKYEKVNCLVHCPKHSDLLDFKIKRVNVVKYPHLAEKFRVNVFPSLVIFDKGKEAKRIDGHISEPRKLL